MATCEAILARCLVRATPTEIGRPSSVRTRAGSLRDVGRRAEQMGAARHIGEGLVDGNALDQGGEIVEHLDGGVAQPLVVLEVAADEDELRTEFTRPPARHAAAHAEGLGFVGGRQHDAATDGDGLAAQGRVEQLLDRGVESVEVGMEDGGRHIHPECSQKTNREHCRPPVKPPLCGRRLTSQVKRISSVRR